MKGIILAGGRATRLYPATKAVSKQMIPIYDKPMIYYPLSILMLAGIREILIISTPKDIDSFKELFSDGSEIGLKFSYKVQESPRGLADAFIVGEDFIGEDNVCLVLGDNIFFGHGLTDAIEKAAANEGATIFGYYVKNPCAYGVVEFNAEGAAVTIEEKPKKPKSSYAVPGLYFYDNNVIDIAKNLKPSQRGEIEITDINLEYLRRETLNVELLGRGIAWLDTGTPNAMLEAANFVSAIQNRQGKYIACIEEIAFRKGYINKKQLLSNAEKLKTDYGTYLQMVADSDIVGGAE